MGIGAFAALVVLFLISAVLFSFVSKKASQCIYEYDTKYEPGNFSLSRFVKLLLIPILLTYLCSIPLVTTFIVLVSC